MKFWSLKQEEGEPVDAYCTRLKVQIDHCDYKREGWPETVKIEKIRDKFVLGIQDDNLKEYLLRESDISLNKLVGLAQRTESSKQPIREMTGASSKSMDAIHENNKPTEFICGQYIDLKNAKHLGKSSAQKRVHVLDQEDSFSVADDKPQVFINAIQVHGV